MQAREVTQDFFIISNTDLQRGSPDYLLAAKLTKVQLKQRWKSAAGQEIFSRWKANSFDRRSLDELVGKFYGHTDIRGITLVKEDLSGVDLSNVDLYGANLENAMFKYTNFTGSYLSESNIKGTCFDWADMKDVFLDNVDFDSRTSFIGVNLSLINFTLAALLQDLAIGQARVINLQRKRPILAATLRITSDYGRSFPRFLLSCMIVILLFGFAYSFFPGSLVKTGAVPVSINFGDSLYCSLMTFAASSCDFQSASVLGKLLVAIETVIGYLMTALLVAILIKRTIGD